MGALFLTFPDNEGAPSAPRLIEIYNTELPKPRITI